MTEADFLWKFISVASICGNFILLFVKLRGGPEKRSIVDGRITTTAEQSFATEAQIKDVQDDVEQLGDAMQEMERRINNRIDAANTTLNHDRKVSIGRLHDQLKDTEKKLAGVEATVTSHTGQLDRIDSKLTLLLQQSAH